MDNVCLTCRIPGELCNLTSKEYENAARKFASLITLQIQAKDSLPWYICHKCIETLNTVVEFLRWCEEAEQRMREELGRQSEKTHEELEMATSSIKEEPVDTMEDEQLLHENASGNYTTEEDLADGDMDLDADRKDIILEEPKLAEPTHTGSSFEKGPKVYQHMKTSGNDRLQQRDRNFSCQSCQKLYVSYSSLYQHVKKTHMGKKPFVCLLCGKDFPQEVDLEAHRHPCKQSLTQKQIMLEHIECEFCGKSFVNRGKLNEHRRIHTKEKPFECPVCHRKFRRSSERNLHRLTHTDVRPYKCDMCNKTFRQRNSLIEHGFVHCERERFKCTICGKVLRYPRTLKRHMRLIHDDGATVRQSTPKTVKAETSTVSAEESMSAKQESSELIEHWKEEELSDECVYSCQEDAS